VPRNMFEMLKKRIGSGERMMERLLAKDDIWLSRCSEGCCFCRCENRSNNIIVRDKLGLYMHSDPCGCGEVGVGKRGVM